MNSVYGNISIISKSFNVFTDIWALRIKIVTYLYFLGLQMTDAKFDSRITDLDQESESNCKNFVCVEIICSLSISLNIYNFDYAKNYGILLKLHFIAQMLMTKQGSHRA